MKNLPLIILYILPAWIVTIPCMRQAHNGKISDTQEIRLNDSIAIMIKPLTSEEYFIRKQISEEQFHKPYQIITDKAVAEQMLNGKLKFIDVTEDDIHYDKEITYKDGNKQRYTWEVDFVALYPELEILLFKFDSGGDYAIDLNDSSGKSVGNPHYYALSPDKQWRINGEGPDIVYEGFEYFLEKWNQENKKYEYAAPLFGNRWFFRVEWFWKDNVTLLYSDGESFFNEMEVIIK